MEDHPDLESSFDGNTSKCKNMTQLHTSIGHLDLGSSSIMSFQM